MFAFAEGSVSAVCPCQVLLLGIFLWILVGETVFFPVALEGHHAEVTLSQIWISVSYQTIKPWRCGLDFSRDIKAFPCTCV